MDLRAHDQQRLRSWSALPGFVGNRILFAASGAGRQKKLVNAAPSHWMFDAALNAFAFLWGLTRCQTLPASIMAGRRAAKTRTLSVDCRLCDWHRLRPEKPVPALLRLLMRAASPIPSRGHRVSSRDHRRAVRGSCRPQQNEIIAHLYPPDDQFEGLKISKRRWPASLRYRYRLTERVMAGQPTRAAECLYRRHGRATRCLATNGTAWCRGRPGSSPRPRLKRLGPVDARTVLRTLAAGRFTASWNPRVKQRVYSRPGGFGRGLPVVVVATATLHGIGRFARQGPVTHPAHPRPDALRDSSQTA